MQDFQESAVSSACRSSIKVDQNPRRFKKLVSFHVKGCKENPHSLVILSKYLTIKAVLFFKFKINELFQGISVCHDFCISHMILSCMLLSYWSRGVPVKLLKVLFKSSFLPPLFTSNPFCFGENCHFIRTSWFVYFARFSTFKISIW